MHWSPGTLYVQRRCSKPRWSHASGCQPLRQHLVCIHHPEKRFLLQRAENDTSWVRLEYQSFSLLLIKPTQKDRTPNFRRVPMGLRPIVSGQSPSMDGTDFVVDDSSKKVCGRSVSLKVKYSCSHYLQWNADSRGVRTISSGLSSMTCLLLLR